MRLFLATVTASATDRHLFPLPANNPRENGAMVEVFYEQLNFEMLTESEAYGFVNLLADFGGQLGLWCGISFLTCCEFLFLFVETTYMSAEHNWLLYKKKKAEKEKARQLWGS
ncbi:hypothetical protein L596_003474 [Steinernema carpocapsae]|uniref:Uncharacterized protein n=1 Tax=Steinernema carpocapsae TaxID=34508 RepID=A0A4U8USM3_STECR|nr:hypothetical protein L596_003474 [Steinernema carpocapsae]